MKLSNIQELQKFGYTVIPDLYSHDILRRIVDSILEYKDVYDNAYVWWNCLDIEATWELACNPKVLAVVKALLGEVNIGNYFFKQLAVGIEGMKGLSPHTDSVQHFPHGAPPLAFGVNTLTCLTDFHEDNAPTHVLPCSHLGGVSRVGTLFETQDELDELSTPFHDLVPIHAKAGSVIMWDTRTVHMQPSPKEFRIWDERVSMDVSYFAKWFDIRVERQSKGKEWPQIKQTIFNRMPFPLQDMLSYRGTC